MFEIFVCLFAAHGFRFTWPYHKAMYCISFTVIQLSCLIFPAEQLSHLHSLPFSANQTTTNYSHRLFQLPTSLILGSTSSFQLSRVFLIWLHAISFPCGVPSLRPLAILQRRWHDKQNLKQAAIVIQQPSWLVHGWLTVVPRVRKLFLEENGIEAESYRWGFIASNIFPNTWNLIDKLHYPPRNYALVIVSSPQ